MAVTWADLPLTPAQRMAMRYFASIVPRGEPKPIPAYTHSQAKAAAVFLREVEDLVRPALDGARYTMEYHRQKAIENFEAANP